MAKTDAAQPLDGDPFDFIIVGAGTAGSVLAARLSENGKSKVLLLEAGPPDRSPWIHLPLGYSRLFTNPRYNWMHRSEPEPRLNDRPLYQPHGKVLGGSSSINGMMYVRGNPKDFDDWAESGCDGWSYAEVLPFFRKSEDQARGPNAWHGVGGPLKVGDPPMDRELPNALCAAAQAAGLVQNEDFNGAAQDGFGYYQANIRRGRRSSTARGYLTAARRRANIRILTEAAAEQIVIENGAATGVIFRRHGQKHVASGRQIIVSAGTIGSPHLLMLSGIGSAAHLREFGIGCHSDLPEVGANLQDHTCTRLSFRCTKPITINDTANSWLKCLGAGLSYVTSRTGYLAENGIYVGGFARSDAAQDRPDIQMIMSAWSIPERSEKGVKPHPFPGFTISPKHLNPNARGSIRLRSADVSAPPVIRFNFFESDYDIRAMMAAIRLVRQICAQAAIRPYIATEIQPGKDVESDEDMIAFIRATADSDVHAAGSCRMGSDAGAVVDPRLRVNGIRNLSVADASIMPRITRGGPHAATVMIGEKAADMILVDKAN